MQCQGAWPTVRRTPNFSRHGWENSAAGKARCPRDLEDREVYDAIENLFVLERPQRRLFTVANLLPRALAGRLHKWIEGGRYAGLFDNVHDTLTVDRLQVFDFESMRAYPVLLEPLLFDVLHRVISRIQDPREAATLKVCVMDALC